MLAHILAETGLTSLHRSPRDVKLLCLMRLVRMAAYGASTLVLVSLLEARGASKTQAGLFMTLTLAGDVLVSLVLTAVADGVGRRVVLGVGAVMMVGSGVVFVVCKGFWVLLCAAVLGVISPSGNEIGPFRAIEESIVAHLTPAEDRSDIYAWYGLLGPAGTAVGFMSAGWLIHEVVERREWTYLEAYRLIFVLYAAMGLVKFVLVLFMSSETEAEKKTNTAGTTEEEEQESLLHGERQAGAETGRNGDAAGAKKARWRNMLPGTSRESVVLVGTLCFLFAVDSFASGMVPLSWITFFYKWKFDLEEGRLGSVFFITSFVSAASMLVASSLAKRFGNVKTMVFTHLPSTIFLALIPIPSTLVPSLTFLILRACTQSMDTAPRSAFLAAVLRPDERTAAMGLLNIVRTMAQTTGPLITGVLVDRRLFWVAFVVAGALKAVYDLGLLGVFGGYELKKREEARREGVEGGEERMSGDERG